MIPGFHGFDLIVILIVALLIFGPKRLPEMGSAIGKSIKEFRKGMSELTHDKDEPLDDTLPPIPSRQVNRLSSRVKQDPLFETDLTASSNQPLHSEPVVESEKVRAPVSGEGEHQAD
jgi:TatA/E family protein of Tat protein translocase